MKTILLTLAMAALLLTGLESLARTTALQNALDIPSLGSNHRQLDIQFAALERFAAQHHGVDCIFLGSSMISLAIDPAIFEAAYQAQTGEVIHCFNFGVLGLKADNAAIVARYLVEQYQPAYLFFGTTSIDYDQLDRDGVDIQKGAWLHYLDGEFNLPGWLIDQSHLYRYLLRYQAWADEDFRSNLDAVRLEDERVSANGYRPEPVPADHSGNLAPLPHAVDQDARFGGERLQPLGEIAALNGDKTRVLVFEGVVHPACLYLGGSRAAAHQAFIDAATAYLAQWDVPFWATTFPLRIPDEMWVDCIHLFADGAAIFSRWLGAQVGAAAGQHRWEKPLLPDIIPPTSETVYQPLSAESAAAFDQFKAGFEGFPTDAIFWNPSSELEDPIGDFFRLVESVNAAPDEAVFELMIALNNLRYTDDLPLTTTQLAAPNAWRGDKQARHLREAGFDYLLFSDRWAQYLSGEEQETLRTQYQAVGRWSHPALDTTYILLKVGGE